MTALSVKNGRTMKTQAVIFDSKGVVRVGDVSLPPCGPTQIRARTLFSFVSPGTELRMLGGHYGAEGRFPFVPGYASVGRVEEVGAEARGFRVGDLVSCRNSVSFADCTAMYGGHAGAHVFETVGEDVPVLLPSVADDADALRYVAAEFAAIPLRGVDAASPRPGENCCVVGQGAIGQISARFFAAAGCRVTVADADPRRLASAQAEGWGAVCVRDADAEERLARLGNGGFDIVVEASGSTPGFLLALKLLRRKPQNYTEAFKVEPIGFYRGDWPRLVVQANYLEKVPVDPWDFMDGEGVTVLTPFDRGVEERQKAIEAIRTGTLRVDDLVAGVRKPVDMPDGYEALARREISTLVCDWRQ